MGVAGRADGGEGGWWKNSWGVVSPGVRKQPGIGVKDEQGLGRRGRRHILYILQPHSTWGRGSSPAAARFAFRHVAQPVRRYLGAC